MLDFVTKSNQLELNGGQGRANVVDDDREFLQAMKDAGAVYIGYGLGSATDEILTSMMKNITEAKLQRSGNSKSVGLKVVAQYMMGFPGEVSNQS